MLFVEYSNAFVLEAFDEGIVRKVYRNVLVEKFLHTANINIV